MNIRLPVSGLEIALRQPSGAEDVLLVEATVCDIYLALALLSRIAQVTNSSVVPWEDLPIPDLDLLLLQVRQMVFGSLIQADAFCPVKDCGTRIEVALRIGDYLVHHRPCPVVDVEQALEAGWLQFQDVAISFRLPTVADRLAIANQPEPECELVRRCVRPSELSAEQLDRVEQAMEALAPNLDNTLQGICPECGKTVDIYFDPEQFTLQELRNQAAFIYDDVHLLASHYQWSESEILALPRHRRRRYADKIRQERSKR